jgi:hypothetical protein
MKSDSFDATPEFQHFTAQMRKLIAVPKVRLDELVQQARESSPRKGAPNAPGRKRNKRRSKS